MLSMYVRFCSQMRRFVKDDSAPTAVEYGLMVALIAAVVIAGATLLGVNTNTVFNTTAGTIAGAGAAS